MKLFSSHITFLSLQQPGIGGEGEIHIMFISHYTQYSFRKGILTGKRLRIGLKPVSFVVPTFLKLLESIHVFQKCFYIICSLNKELLLHLQQAERWYFYVRFNMYDRWVGRVGQAKMSGRCKSAILLVVLNSSGVKRP